jgi:hypothetical protein
MPEQDNLPGFETKRKILFGEKTSDEEMRETGKQFMDAEHYDDALEFFQRCEAGDLTREIARRAMDDGNTPLYMRAKRVLEEDISEDEWNRLAQNAENSGKYTAAHLAHKQAGHEEEAARLRELMPGVQPQADQSEGTDQESDGPGEP